ncbi:MAG: hypothetical protein HC925_08080 [Coleofasciculaceae cyanobacterium SM2_3_26]|nr:hypothetical protein [Coleofasciculaceae cyanobacterium SM2_3_26]
MLKMNRLSHNRLSHTRTVFYLPLLAAFIFLYGCTGGSEPAADAPEQAESAPEAPAEEGATSEAPSAEPPTTEAESGETASEVDLSQIIGTKEEGWLPKVLMDKNLKDGMTPEEAGKLVPGAEEVDDFGFSEVAVEDVPGLQRYKFYFAKDDSGKPTQLQSVTLIFSPDLNSKIAFKELAEAFAAKYGEIEASELEEEIVTWIGPGFASAQLTKGFNEFEGYEFDIRLPGE